VCTFKAAAEKLQEGWVKVAFIPEILYGEDRVRPVATDQGWESRGGQKIETYYDQEFTLELNTGEFVVMGMADEKPGSLGELFFRGWDPTGKFQRVMIVRLAGMQRVKPTRGGRSEF
jgi:hypothetical protein